MIPFAVIGALHSTLRAAQDTKEGPRTTWDGVYSDDQAKRGNAIYTKTCAQCHGSSMEGVDMAPPLAGGQFMSNWDGTTLSDLTDRIRLSMPQDNPGILSRQEAADVTAYLLSANKFPAGKTELAKEAELLKQIKFQAAKPSAH